MKGNRARLLRLALGATAALGVVVGASPAHAAQDYWSFLGDASRALGANLYQDTVGFCTKDTQSGPNGAGQPTFEFTDVAVVEAGQAFTPGSTNAARGADIPAESTGLLAYLVYRGTELARAGDATGAMAAHHAMTSLSSGGPIASPPTDAVAALSRQLSQEAAQLAGPYTVSARLDGDVLTEVGVRSASGNWVPGYRIEFTAQGAVRAPGAVTSASAPLTVPVELTGFGQARITATASGLPPTSTRVLRDPVVQDFFAVGSPSSATVSTTTAHAFELSTSARDSQLAVGDELVDVVTVESAAWPGSAELEVTVTAYGPFDVPQNEQPEVPEDAPLAGQASFTVNEPGVYESPAVGTAAAPGFYTFVAEAAGQAGAFFEVTETAVAPWTATVRTQAFERDGQLWDSVEVSGLPETEFTGLEPWDAVGEITHELYFFPAGVAVEEGAAAGLEPLQTWTTAAANGTYEVGGFPLADAQPGTYVFVASFPGDARVRALRTSEADTAEQWVVESAPPEESEQRESEGPEATPESPAASTDVPTLPQTGATLGWGLLAGSGVLGGASALASRRRLQQSE